MRTAAVAMIQVLRGDRIESEHAGHAVVCRPDGSIVAAWGDPEAVIYPRSSCKMLQALPLVESGAAAGLGDDALALACASHQGAAMHTGRVAQWLAELGLTEADLRCGTHWPHDTETRDALIRSGASPCQLHNNCSGKHAGFLHLGRHLGAGPDYIDPDHPVQRAVRAAFEEVTGAPSPGHAIDGCSAPNFATRLSGLAGAMARFAEAAVTGGYDRRGRAMARLCDAMVAHPELVAGEGRSCTELMRAMGGQVAVKTGAEAVFVAILPRQRLGVALKIADGATRASEAAIARLLVHLGALSPDAPVCRRLVDAELRNWQGTPTGRIIPAPGFP